jgi:hypothetical protein
MSMLIIDLRWLSRVPHGIGVTFTSSPANSLLVICITAAR